MPLISFDKYQGTGNDFIMIDDRQGIFPENDLPLISSLCHRKFGVGADGLILVRNHEAYDFEMIYFNPDGSQSLCGNGSRCAVMFSRELGIIGGSTTFMSIEGPLRAEIKDQRVHLEMPDVNGVSSYKDDLFLNTGSPHYVQFVPDADEIDVFHEGKKIRNLPDFLPAGTNVNFVQVTGIASLYVRTYERGVEDETLSCGTGVTASALAMGLKERQEQIRIRTRGGNLEVSFKSDGSGNFTDICLIGPAVKVFSGEIEFS
ncbi:MAG: diaminopimelate epimerase [Cyclobacteriaceae bacterium]|nr:diaminopimelate epimerase [Cyclobacteriaceae bacterium]